MFLDQFEPNKGLSTQKEKHIMLWITLFNKIGKQPIKNTQHHHVYALLENPKTHTVEKVYLDLQYDASGHPYFIKKNDNNKPKRPNHGHNKHH